MSLKKLVVTVITILLISLALSSMPVVEAQSPHPDEPGPDAAFGAINPSYKVSDSPWLQLPEELRDVPPALPSKPPGGGEATDDDPRTMVMYDFATGTETRIPPDHPAYQSIEPYQASTPAFSGLLPAGMTGFESVLPPDGRSQISPTTSFPWRSIVKLYAYYGDGAVLGCSGAIIQCDGHGYHVLTAGHCIYSHGHGGWATSVRVIPGLDGTTMPYNLAWSTNLRTYQGWIDNGDTEHDMAFVTLDRNVGDFTGWMGRQTCNPPGGCSQYTSIVNSAGYPADKGGETMWYHGASGHSVDEYNHWYYIDTYGGQSGSPVWSYYSSTDSRYILTVHTCGTGGCGIDGKGVNHGTRLNQAKYDDVNTVCGLDSPPTDYADLIDDGQTWSGFNPTVVRPGATGFSTWSDVRNVGTASSGGFYVSYYASTNTTISTGDYLIGHDYVSSIPAFNYGDSDWSGTFPSGVPDGLYYVGWIIDSLGHVTEFDEGNNIAYKTTYRVLVDGTAPSNPSSVWSTSHTVGAWSNDNTINVSWSGASDGSGSGVDGYSWAFSTSPSSIPDTTVDTTGTSITGMALGNSSNWYFHVRTRDNVGNWNSGAVHLGPFRIDGSSPSNPTSVTETHGAPNNTWQNSVGDPAFTWSGASDVGGSGVAGYNVYWGTNPSGTSSYWTTSASYNPGPVSSPGVRYLRIRTRDNAGNNSSWTTLFTFKYDASAPSNPTSVTETHGAPDNIWQNSVGDPNFTWSGASDGSGSGVAGYNVYWGTSSSGTSSTWTNIAAYNPGPVSSPGVRYLRVRTRDNAGNNSSWTTLFTFKYDASAPSNPTSATETHGAPDNTWQNSVGDPAFTWSGASDGSGSGVAGYNVYWGTSPSGTSSTWTNMSSYNPGPVSSPGVRYLRVRTHDNAGNTSGWTTLFTFKYDASAPSNPTSVTETHGAPDNTWQNSVGDPAFTWSGASDGSGSGLAGYYVYWGTSPSGTSTYWTTGAGFDPSPVSSPNVLYLRVQTRDNAGNNSGWTTLFTFKYDASPPSNPSSVSSSSHTVGAWSNDNTINVSWSGASDGSGSGVHGYSYEWSATAGTIPDTSVDTTGSTATSPPLSDGDSWYFYIRTRDHVGNWNSGAAHLGPFRIDTASPSNPTSATETHGAPDNSWQNSVGDPAFTWSGAFDVGGAGVAGYYVYWGTSPSGTSSTWTTSASFDPGPVSSPGVRYLRVQTKDNAGNTSGWTTLFTFMYDGSAPTNPTSVTETHGAPDNTWQNSVGDPAFTWSGASDGSGSGLAGYYVYWGTSPSGTSTTWTTSASYDPSSVSSPSVHYLRVQTRDNAGNNSSWLTLFTFKYDASPPSNPTSASSSSHTVGAWSNDNTINMSWSGASDGSGSGVHGYSYEWSATAGTIPDTSVDTTGSTTTSPPLSDGDSWYFHIRTRDEVGNWNGDAAHAGPFLVDTIAPSCAVAPLPVLQKAIFFDVTWSGTDATPGSGLDSYDVQYRVGAGGVWVDWVAGTTAISATFGPWSPVRLEDGQIYYFRCRARDAAANLGTYAGGDGDTWTTIEKSTIFLPLVQR